MAVAGANIANAAGRPDKGSVQPWTVTVIQDPIGAYVEAPTETRFAAATNYIGYQQQPRVQDQRPRSGQHRRHHDALRSPTGRCRTTTTMPSARQPTAHSGFVRQAPSLQVRTCTVTAGAATAGAGTFECNVTGGVVVGDFFWANVTADHLRCFQGKRNSTGAIYVLQGPPPAGTPFVGGIAVSHDGCDLRFPSIYAAVLPRRPLRLRRARRMVRPERPDDDVPGSCRNDAGHCGWADGWADSGQEQGVGAWV